MNDKERRENPEDSFDCGYHLYAQEKHKERVAQNPSRLEYAVNLLREHGIEFTVKNETIGHIHAYRKSDDILMQFWVGTGKILGRNERGIHNFIKLLESKND